MGNTRKRVTACCAAGLVSLGIWSAPPAAAVDSAPSAAAVDTSRCDNPREPTWFYPHLRNAADNPNDAVPSGWGDSVNMARIVCWESSFDPGAYNPALPTYGLGQMTRNNIDAARVSFHCYWEGGCVQDRRHHQLLAALRYANQRYGSPAAGWQHIRDHGWW